MLQTVSLAPGNVFQEVKSSLALFEWTLLRQVASSFVVVDARDHPNRQRHRELHSLSPLLLVLNPNNEGQNVNKLGAAEFLSLHTSSDDDRKRDLLMHSEPKNDKVKIIS